jgi:hypothetical protein
MKPDERFKNYFDDVAWRYQPGPGSLDAVHARVKHRRNRRALVSAALIVMIGVGSAALLRSGSTYVALPTTTALPPSTSTPAVVPLTTTAAEPTTTTATEAMVEIPGFEWQRVTDLPDSDPAQSHVLDPIATNDGFLTIEQVFGLDGKAYTDRVWTSTDGAAWTATNNDSFDSNTPLNVLVTTSYGLYAGGTTGVDPTLWRSDRGGTWDAIDLSLPQGPAIDETYQKIWSGINQIVAGPHGVMVLGVMGTSTDWNKLIEPFLPDGRALAEGSLSWDINTSTITVYSEPDHTFLVSISASDLGVDVSKLGAITSEPVVWYSPDGQHFSLLEEVPGTRAGDPLDMMMGAATDDGFVVFMQTSPQTVWTSADGSSWEQLTTSGLPDAGFFNGVASMDGRIVIIGGTASGQAAYYSDDGVSWKKADIGLGTSAQVETVTAGPTGWFITGKASSTRIPPPAMWVSPDGATWGRVDLPDDVFGLQGIPFFGAPATGQNSILLTGTEETNLGDGSVTGSTRVFYLGTMKP